MSNEQANQFHRSMGTTLFSSGDRMGNSLLAAQASFDRLCFGLRCCRALLRSIDHFRPLEEPVISRVDAVVDGLYCSATVPERFLFLRF